MNINSSTHFPKPDQTPEFNFLIEQRSFQNTLFTKKLMIFFNNPILFLIINIIILASYFNEYACLSRHLCFFKQCRITCTGLGIMKENIHSVMFGDYLPLVGKSVVKFGWLLNCSSMEGFHSQVEWSD